MSKDYNWQLVPVRLTKAEEHDLGAFLNDRFPGLNPGNARSYARAVYAALQDMRFAPARPALDPQGSEG